MTGTILQLPPGGRTGIIRSEDGFRFGFAANDVVGDFDTLAVGHRVNFEIQSAHGHRKAIRVLREPSRPTAPRKPDAPPDLRYMGFDQKLDQRRYRFDAVGPGHAPEHFIVTVDVELLRRCHVSVQELPALCMHKLAADLKAACGPVPHQLVEDDLSAFLAARAAKAGRKKPRAPLGQRRTPPAWGGTREPNAI